MQTKNKILVVEDEAINIAIYKSLLESRYELFIAETGEAAREIMANNPVDIVLLDLMLPDINGIELCKTFKTDETSRKIPILIVTAVEDQAAKVRGLEAGANDFLNKPIDRVELLLKIKNHLEIKSLHDELNDSFESIVTINNISHRIMKDFDPQYFNFSRDLFALLEGYTSQVKHGDELPSYIMITFKEQGVEPRTVVYVYRIEQAAPVFIDDSFCILESDDCIFKGMEGNPLFLNRSETRETEEEFAARFPREVRQKTGPILNFIGYRGKEVCVVGFNYKRTVNRLMGQTLKSFALTANFFKVIRDQVSEVRQAHIYTLNSLARAAEASDRLTGAHIVRVNHYSRFIAGKLNLSQRLVDDISVMAQMHDIGKIHIHPNIIRKTESLTEAEWREIKKHPIYGAEILGDSGYMEIARNICLGHHENFDGSGYPFGKKGEEIPLEARIVRLADVYDSLRSTRTYQPGVSHGEAYDIIVNGSQRLRPTYFDPMVLAVFKEYHHEFKVIYSELAEE